MTTIYLLQRCITKKREALRLKCRAAAPQAYKHKISFEVVGQGIVKLESSKLRVIMLKTVVVLHVFKAFAVVHC